MFLCKCVFGKLLVFLLSFVYILPIASSVIVRAGSPKKLIRRDLAESSKSAATPKEGGVKQGATTGE